MGSASGFAARPGSAPRPRCSRSRSQSTGCPRNRWSGKWQPAQVLSSFRPVRVSNHRRRPRLASRRSTGRPRRCSKVDSIFPVNPCCWRTNVRSRSISPAGAGAKPSPNPRARTDRMGTRSRSGRRAMAGAPSRWLGFGPPASGPPGVISLESPPVTAKLFSIVLPGSGPHGIIERRFPLRPSRRH